jgi:hypothetical protein
VEWSKEFLPCHGGTRTSDLPISRRLTPKQPGHGTSLQL